MFENLKNKTEIVTYQDNQIKVKLATVKELKTYSKKIRDMETDEDKATETFNEVILAFTDIKLEDLEELPFVYLAELFNLVVLTAFKQPDIKKN